MMRGMRIIRVSKIDDDKSPFKKATLYKLNHRKRYPGLFIKVDGALFIDLDRLDAILEDGRK